MMCKEDFVPLIDHLLDCGEVYADIVVLLKELHMITPEDKGIAFRLNRHSQYNHYMHVELRAELEHEHLWSTASPNIQQHCRWCGALKEDYERAQKATAFVGRAWHATLTVEQNGYSRDGDN